MMSCDRQQIMCSRCMEHYSQVTYLTTLKLHNYFKIA